MSGSKAAVPPNIALIGMMGSGKSTVGRLLAERLQWEFADTDAEIVARAGRSIADIFAVDGEAAFRETETGVVCDVVQRTHCVIATGGGAILRVTNREALWGRCWVVWLSATAEEHAQRVSMTERRPVLERYDDPVAGAREVLAQREPLYSRAHYTVNTTGRTTEEVADAIVSAWRRFVEAG